MRDRSTYRNRALLSRGQLGLVVDEVEDGLEVHDPHQPADVVVHVGEGDVALVGDHLPAGLDEDTVAALSSSLVMTLKRSLKPFCEEIPDEMVLTASEGKLIFLGLGAAYLVAVTKRNLKLESDLVEIRSMARKIRHRCEFSV